MVIPSFERLSEFERLPIPDPPYAIGAWGGDGLDRQATKLPAPTAIPLPSWSDSWSSAIFCVVFGSQTFSVDSVHQVRDRRRKPSGDQAT